jgi:phage terminase small subunit
VAKLNSRQRAFIYHYIQTWNATEAARRAGYAEKYLHTNAPKLLQNTTIRAEIDAQLKALAMSAEEVLARLQAQATASMAEFVNVNQETGEPAIDLRRAEQSGKLHVLKKVSITDKGLTIELYDAQAALVHIGKHLGMFVEKREITGPGGGPIQVIGIGGINPDDDV